jgi:uncharacterized protein
MVRWLTARPGRSPAHSIGQRIPARQGRNTTSWTTGPLYSTYPPLTYCTGILHEPREQNSLASENASPPPGRTGVDLRWLQLLGGLFGFGLAVPLMIRSGLGLGPWDAFHVGVHRLTGISVGMASILVGLVIVLASLRLEIRPGPGTIANMLLIGIFIDLVLPLVPEAGGWRLGLTYYVAGIALAGLSTGMYMGAGLGNGPRDGLMLGISRYRGWPVRRVRTVIELSALLCGWAMGGAIGAGTLLFAVSIGPAAQLGLQLFGAAPGPASDRPTLANRAATPRGPTPRPRSRTPRAAGRAGGAPHGESSPKG